MSKQPSVPLDAELVSSPHALMLLHSLCPCGSLVSVSANCKLKENFKMVETFQEVAAKAENGSVGSGPATDRKDKDDKQKVDKDDKGVTEMFSLSFQELLT